MAQLNFDGVQPVGFYDKTTKQHRQCVPHITQGQRLRLQQIKFDTELDAQEAYEVLADCFPDDHDFVLDFIKNEMMPRDPQTLRNYLLNGAEGLKAEQGAYDAVGEAIKDKVKEALSDIEVNKHD